MAERKKRGKVKNPSAAQLKNWARLGRMAKARGRAVRAARRGVKPNPVLFSHPPRPRPAPKQPKTKPAPKPKNKPARRNCGAGSPMHRAQRHGQGIANRGRRRNDAGAAVTALNSEFVGRQSTSVYPLGIPSEVPVQLAELGALVQIVTNKETFDFAPADSYVLVADENRRLHIATTGKERFEPDADLGHIHQLTYFAVKSHLDAKPVEYYHDFEGQRPRLMTDREGLLVIRGGSYSIGAAGIEG